MSKDFVEYKGGDFRNSLEYENDSMFFKFFKKIKVNNNKVKEEFYKNIVISIQASKGHYSIPRKDLDKFEYLNFEIAFILDNQFLNIDIFKEYLNELLYKKFKKYDSGGVYGFVPVGDIQILIESIC